MNLGVFGVNSSAFSKSTRQFMTLLTATAAQLCVLQPQPGSSPPCPSDPRARLESLGIWAYGSTSARKTDRPRRFVQEKAEDLLRRCYETA